MWHTLSDIMVTGFYFPLRQLGLWGGAGMGQTKPDWHPLIIEAKWRGCGVFSSFLLLVYMFGNFHNTKCP